MSLLEGLPANTLMNDTQRQAFLGEVKDEYAKEPLQKELEAKELEAYDRADRTDVNTTSRDHPLALGNRWGSWGQIPSVSIVRVLCWDN